MNEENEQSTKTSRNMSETTLTAVQFSQRVIKDAQSITEDSHNAFTAKPTIETALQLLTAPQTCQFHSRQLSYLDRLAARTRSCGGVLLSEISSFTKLLTVLEDKLSEVPDYKVAIKQLISLITGALLKQRTSDETNYAKDTIQLLEKVTMLLRIGDFEMRHGIIRMIEAFWSAEQLDSDVRKVRSGHLKDNIHEIRPCTKDYQQSVVERSNLIVTIIQAMALFSNDHKLRLFTLTVLEKLTMTSSPNCQKFVQAKGPEYVVLLMADANKQLLHMLIDLVWNSLENGPKDEVVDQLKGMTSLTSMSAAFRKLLRSPLSESDKQMRNDLLTIFMQLARECPAAAFIETRFLSDLIKFGCSQSSRHLTNVSADFEFIQMLLTCVTILTEDSGSLRAISETNFMEFLLLPVQKLDEIYPTRTVYQWSIAQKEELQLLSLSLLSTIAPKLAKKFYDLTGPHLLMTFLFWSFQTDFSGHGNGVLATGGRGSARAQCRLALRVVRALCSETDSLDGIKDHLITSFLQEGVMELLLLTLANVNNITDGDNKVNDFVYIEDDQIDLEMQEDMLVIISLICESDPAHKEACVETKLVKIIIHYLRDLPGKVVSGLRCDQLLLGVLDCLFNSILGNEAAEDKFLALEGAFLLVDLLQKTPSEMHPIVLSSLVELTENPKSIRHLLTWRGTDPNNANKFISLPQLLIQLWRDEEKRIGVIRGPLGELVDKEFPLAGEAQRNTIINQTEIIPGVESAALGEMSENTRTRIYCLLSRIGFGDLPGVQVQSGDYVTLAVIEKYFNLKIDEVWDEVFNELENENTKLIEADAEAAETIKTSKRERAKVIINLQEDLKVAKSQHENHEERQLFDKIREKYRQNGKMVEKWEDYVDRTSKYATLKAAKDNMVNQIEQSRARQDSDATHHKLNLDLTTTTFQGRHIFVESTPSELARNSEAKYETN